MKTTTNLDALYNAMMSADDAFQAAVIRQFGKKNSGTMRYMGSKHNPETHAAAVAFWNSCAAYLDAKKAA